MIIVGVIFFVYFHVNPTKKFCCCQFDKESDSAYDCIKQNKDCSMITTTPASLELMIEKNKHFGALYQNSDIIRFITSNDMEKEACRERLLDLIQTLSNYFQKVVLLRSVLSEHNPFSASALEHLKEEFCHNEQLMKERKCKLPAWDPIVEATCSWFTWKMFTTNDEEKIVLIHFVLETSGSIFFKTAHHIMEKYMMTEYFKIHSVADEHHEQMGIDLLKNLPSAKYEQLMTLQKQAWSIFMAASDRIAMIATTHLTEHS